MKAATDTLLDCYECGGVTKSWVVLSVRDLFSRRKTIRTRCNSCGRTSELSGSNRQIREALSAPKDLFGWFAVTMLVCISLAGARVIAAESTGDQDCLEWFQKTGTDANSSDCEMECSLADTDMSSFACASQCESLCKPNCRTPKAGGCDFYRSCVEEKFRCGNDGYPIAYGEKYCHRFRALGKRDLSGKGLEWREFTLNCLQHVLADLLFSSSLVNTCSELKTFAFKSHVTCYTSKDHSVCDLKVGDWTTITATVDFRDALSEEGRTQVIEVIKLCKNRIVGEREQVLAVLESPYGISDRDGETTHDKARHQLQELDEKLRYIETLR